MTRDSVIEGRGIGRVFGQGELALRALWPTDITVTRGEVLVIQGPSGSGKTTLLSILGLVLSPTEGEVLIQGKLVARDPDGQAMARSEFVGFVFQQFNLLPSLSALNNVAVPLLIRGTVRRERAAQALRALEQVGLGDKAGRKPRMLSGGQQQRVAIARALVSEAPVVLCDEPTASLDAASGSEVLAILQRLAHHDGRAVVIVTHDERVLAIADRRIEVIDGRVQTVATISKKDAAAQ